VAEPAAHNDLERFLLNKSVRCLAECYKDIVMSPASLAQIVFWFLLAVVSPQVGEQSVPPFPRHLPTQATYGPFVSISIPTTVSLDSVQIAYMLGGPFGGLSSSIRPTSVSRSYRIFTTVDKQRATDVKIVVLAPGCEIAKFDVHLDSTAHAGRTFQCQPAKTVDLSGQINPPELALRKDVELVIDYEPVWVNYFFGIMDGPLSHFRVAETIPKPDGTFRVNLPLFAIDAADTSDQPRSSFRLSLIEKQTLRSIAEDLVPEASEFRLTQRTLRISPQYPDGLKFVSAQ
jgi:hypothetical protein